MSTGLLLSLVACAPALVQASRLGSWRRALDGLSDAATEIVPCDVPVSVIVPARDASATLTGLLQDLYAQTHRAHMEVIVVDDHSSDGTAALVGSMAVRWPGLRLVRLEDATGKKAALTAGVAAARHGLLLFTDADVRCGPLRVSAVAQDHQRRQWDMLLLPVRTEGHGLLGMLQEQEQAALFAAAVGTFSEGSPALAYGANLAVTRAAFEAAGGYAGERWASGDDVFLLHRMRRLGRNVALLATPTVVVSTEAEPEWRGSLAQRLRWAGKMRGVRDLRGTLGLALGMLLPWLLLALTVCLSRSVRIGDGFLFAWSVMLLAWCAWLFPTLGLAVQAHRWLHGHGSAARAFLALMAFTVYAPVIALASVFVRPRWKGRPA